MKGVYEGGMVCAVILAGGENRRMSVNKAFLKVGGISIIEREIKALSSVFDEMLIVANEPGLFDGLGARVVPDADKFRHVRGPLTGVYSGLAASGRDYCFVAGCDMPFIEPALAAFLAGLRRGHDLVIPRVGPHAEPLFGVYGATALGAMEATLTKGGGRLQDIFRGLDTRYAGEEEMRLFDPSLASFMNVNTPSDLARAEEMEEKRCLVAE